MDIRKNLNIEDKETTMIEELLLETVIEVEPINIATLPLSMFGLGNFSTDNEDLGYSLAVAKKTQHILYEKYKKGLLDPKMRIRVEDTILDEDVSKNKLRVQIKVFTLIPFQDWINKLSRNSDSYVQFAQSKIEELNNQIDSYLGSRDFDKIPELQNKIMMYRAEACIK